MFFVFCQNSMLDKRFVSFLDRLHNLLENELIRMHVPVENIQTILFPLVDRMLLLLCVQQAHTSSAEDEEKEKEQPGYQMNYNFWQVMSVVLKIQEHQDCWKHQKLQDESISVEMETNGTITINTCSSSSDGWHTELAKALETLKDGCWLNDTAIDGYLKLLTERFQRIALLSTDVWKYFDKHKKVPKQKWRLTEVDMVLLPVLRNNNHWMMVIVDVRNSCLIIIDSYKLYKPETNRKDDMM